MRLRWIGLIVVAGILLISATCVGAIIAIGLADSDFSEGDHVAAIEIHGQIVTRDPGGLFAADVASAESIIEQLENAREDSSVRAVLLDIDSPGGGVVASQQIYDEVRRVRDDGIPVVAYFGDTAASGGYYVAAPADYIIANPGTITGSIGAIAMVPNFEELFDKLGIEMQTVASGEMKDMMQPTRPMTEDEREILQQFVDETHQQFVEDVAAGRDMSIEEVQDLANGRIYSGTQAAENGLVDELGDRQFAIDYVGEEAGLGSDPDVREYESEPDFWDLMGGVTSGELGLPSLFDFGVDPRDEHLEVKYQAR